MDKTIQAPNARRPVSGMDDLASLLNQLRMLTNLIAEVYGGATRLLPGSGL